jgi:hypothetical protein
LNGSARARWLKTIEVFNEQGESRQLKLFPAAVEPPEEDPNVARVLLNKVRMERSRQFGNCYVGLELWKQLELDQFNEELVDEDEAYVAWSRIAALLPINRLCEPSSELAVEERWYPATALDDLLGIAEGKVNDTRLYRCLDRLLPHKTQTGTPSPTTLRRVVHGHLRRAALRPDQQLRGKAKRRRTQ